MSGVYTGTGGYEGVPEIRGVLKPLAFGNCRRIVPICIDPELNLYQVHDGPISDVPSVYDSGYLLIQLLDSDDLLAWVPNELEVSAGGYKLDSSRGIFRLACKPNGQILLDCIGLENEEYHGINEGYWE
jgi:hypothetical protein